MKPLFRVLDANLNRAREGLRVCEEVCRFILGDPALTRRCQRLRYRLAKAGRSLPATRLLRARDSRRDPGRPSARPTPGRHRGYRDLVEANAKRTQEALRVLEEFVRLRSAGLGRELGSIRFQVYALEQDLLSRL